MKALLSYDYEGRSYVVRYNSPLDFHLENLTTHISAQDLPPEVANEIAAILEAVEEQ